MRIEPQPNRLVTRICDSLEKTALSKMSEPHAARQLKAGLWALRRIAASPDSSEERLREEVTDIEAVLAEPPLSPVTFGELQARHLELQSRLIELDRRCQSALALGNPSARQTAHTLRALYRRMLDRERAIHFDREKP